MRLIAGNDGSDLVGVAFDGRDEADDEAIGALTAGVKVELKRALGERLALGGGGGPGFVCRYWHDPPEWQDALEEAILFSRRKGQFQGGK